MTNPKADGHCYIISIAASQWRSYKFNVLGAN
jgi:hypothetical protein